MGKTTAQKSFDRLVRLARRLDLPEVVVGTTHGAPALRVRDRPFVSIKGDDLMVLHCPLEMKEDADGDGLLELTSRPTTSGAGRVCWSGSISSATRN
ncbi:MAG: hypothetical protein Q7T08_10285 [Devosia sp.]|nr:hypothetical protein [Devosia sp.]